MKLMQFYASYISYLGKKMPNDEYDFCGITIYFEYTSESCVHQVCIHDNHVMFFSWSSDRLSLWVQVCLYSFHLYLVLYINDTIYVLYRIYPRKFL